MEVSFLDLKEREIINVYNGKKLGRIIDVVFNNSNGIVRGIVAPGDKKIFKKSEDIFIPIERIRRIGDDVILVGLQQEEGYFRDRNKKQNNKNVKTYENYYNRYSNSMNYNNFRMQQTPYQNNNYKAKPNYERQFENRKPIIYSSTAKNLNEQKMYKKNDEEKSSYIKLKPLEKKKYN